MKKLFALLTVAACLALGACTSCKHNPEPVVTGYNYDETVTADYDFIASQYPDFRFYEVDVVYDTTLDCMDAKILTIQTVFQVNDTCIMFQHNADMTVDTIYINDYWMECMPMNARNAVNYDSCMTIIDTMRTNLHTRYLTFRRVLAPPFPENGQYIFGKGLLVIDSYTGDVVDWDETDEVTAKAIETMNETLRIRSYVTMEIPDSVME